MNTSLARAYKITNKSNGKVYIGITTKTIKQRWRKHCEHAKGNSNMAFHKAIRKYGSDNFLVEEIGIYGSWQEACVAEIKLIKKYQSLISEKGYNMTKGGDGAFGYHLSEEARQLIREKKLGTKLSENTKEKLRQAWKKRKLIPISDETRKKMSIANKGRVVKEETRKKISESNKKIEVMQKKLKSYTLV